MNSSMWEEFLKKYRCLSREEYLPILREARKNRERESKERGDMHIKLTLPKQTNKRAEKTSKPPKT